MVTDWRVGDIFILGEMVGVVTEIPSEECTIKSLSGSTTSYYSGSYRFKAYRPTTGGWSRGASVSSIHKSVEWVGNLLDLGLTLPN